VLAFERRPRWLRPLVRHVLATYRERPSDRRRELHAFIEHRLASVRTQQMPQVVRRLLPQAEMGRMRRPVPDVATTPDLAAFLDLHLGELAWLADCRGLERTVADERLRNYRYAWIPRDRGLPRLIEQPKRMLKETQRRVLREILDRVPPHPDAQGFRRGHSVLTHARRHTGQEVVLRFDLEDFFASVSAGRVYGVFRGAGYPEEVAYRLTGLCTNVVPRTQWAARSCGDTRLLGAWHRLGRRLATPHLPQGAPTSPAFANLAAFGLDRRLSALAASTGAVYSRYADDLTLSGGSWLTAHQLELRRLIVEIVRDEGFRLNDRKSRLVTGAGRQVVTGVVVNIRPNIARHEFDRLKAMLHDAVLNGPAAANRSREPDFRGHLLGRISWVESLNPSRGARLRRRFAAIDWPAHDPPS
jgi:RNA-directed DNA polymerase